MSSPTQRSLRHMRDLGYLVAVVEHWNPHARIRQDLFGWIDLLAIRDGETLAVPERQVAWQSLKDGTRN
jgi:hypothetical protein